MKYNIDDLFQWFEYDADRGEILKCYFKQQNIVFNIKNLTISYDNKIDQVDERTFKELLNSLLIEDVKFYDELNNHINLFRFTYVNNFIPNCYIQWNFLDNLQYKYLNGGCCELAYVFYHIYGLELYRLSTYEPGTDILVNDGFHWFVKFKDMYIDIIGLWEEEKLKESWSHFSSNDVELRVSPVKIVEKSVDLEMFEYYINGKTPISDECKTIAEDIIKYLLSSNDVILNIDNKNDNIHNKEDNDEIEMLYDTECETLNDYEIIRKYKDNVFLVQNKEGQKLVHKIITPTNHIWRNLPSYHQIKDTILQRTIYFYKKMSDLGFGPKIKSIICGDKLHVFMEYFPVMLTESYAISHKQEISNVIKDMHSKGYIHGDLHGGNVGIDVNGKIKIMDFDTMFTLDEYYISKLPKEWIDKNFVEQTIEEFIDTEEKDNFLNGHEDDSHDDDNDE